MMNNHIAPDTNSQQGQHSERFLNSPSHASKVGAEDDFGWDWEETMSVATANTGGADFLVDSLPPQLHPAVSLGIHRVSSCAYFSLQGSCISGVPEGDLDLYSLSSEVMMDGRGAAGDDAAADILYHDILMVVMTFLDAESLAAFSETARRSNFEVYYFLQLQLQRALLEDDLSTCLTYKTSESWRSDRSDRLSAIAGSWSISRLASLDPQEAHEVVQEYLDSNCTLRTMPLSHSLAYIREVLRRNGFPGGGYSSSRGGGGGTMGLDQQQAQQALTTSAQAALLIGLVGAATVMSGNVNAEVVESFGTELPNMLFKVGFVGSLMGAARHRWETQRNPQHQQVQQQDGQQPQPQQQPEIDENNNNEQEQDVQSTMRETAEQMREAAEQMARALQDMLQQIRMTATNNDASSRRRGSSRRQSNNGNNNNNGSISRRMYEAFLNASGRRPMTGESASNHNASFSQHLPQVEEEESDHHELFSPNPYDHLPQHGKTNDTIPNDDNHHQHSSDDAPFGTLVPVASDDVQETPAPVKKMPSGCVGAYFRAIQRASNSITRIVKQERRARFDALPNKEMVARSFIDACCSDESINAVRDLVQVRGTIDADGFYVGSDGTETCALHASAFHGATQVLEFLCGGIDERDASQDEGLCCVNLQDANGWTASHFAAGANCVDSLRILADRGANLNVVAENGYTPLQWAQRLRNHEVAEELRRRLEQTDSYHASNNRWIAGASQPLSMIAHRFFGFALVPTH